MHVCCRALRRASTYVCVPEAARLELFPALLLLSSSLPICRKVTSEETERWGRRAEVVKLDSIPIGIPPSFSVR